LKRSAVAAAALLLGGCQLARSAAALAPDPSISLAGRWMVVAVNGRQSGGGERFFAEFGQYGRARFGCNEGSGTYRVENGWLVTGDWIVAAAGCPGRQQFERPTFRVLGQPLAIQRLRSGIRLQGRQGSIDLARWLFGGDRRFFRWPHQLGQRPW
jgi:heat shock protein HslJ